MGIKSAFNLRNKPMFPAVTTVTMVGGVPTEITERKGPIPCTRVEIWPTKSHGPRSFRITKASGYWNVVALGPLIDKSGVTPKPLELKGLEPWEIWQACGSKPYCKLHTRQELIRFLKAFTEDVKEALGLADFLAFKSGQCKLTMSTDKGKTWKDVDGGKLYPFDENVGNKPWKYRMDCLRLENQDNEKFKVKVVNV